MILIVILLIAAIVAIETLVVWGLWNWVIVGLFGVNPISVLMAFGIILVLDVIGSFFKKSVTIKKE
jgi:hypothetical protein